MTLNHPEVKEAPFSLEGGHRTPAVKILHLEQLLLHIKTLDTGSILYTDIPGSILNRAAYRYGLENGYLSSNAQRKKTGQKIGHIVSITTAGKLFLQSVTQSLENVLGKHEKRAKLTLEYLQKNGESEGCDMRVHFEGKRADSFNKKYLKWPSKHELIELTLFERADGHDRGTKSKWKITANGEAFLAAWPRIYRV